MLYTKVLYNIDKKSSINHIRVNTGTRLHYCGTQKVGQKL